MSNKKNVVVGCVCHFGDFAGLFYCCCCWGGGICNVTYVNKSVHRSPHSLSIDTECGCIGRVDGNSQTH